MQNSIKIFDTTLRDGEQSPGFSMTVEQKIQMARQLEHLGVDIIEAGFPISSQGDFEAVREISKQIKRSSVAGLCRTIHKDIDKAWEALQYARKPRIHTFIATSDIHLKHKLGKTREQVIEMAVEAVKYAKSLCEDVEFSAEDAVRSDLEFLYVIFKNVIEAGATVINIPDTVGYSIPDEFGSIIQRIKDNVPNISEVDISVHCHNDLGLAVANSISAVLQGANQVECTINGIGERAGNASLEEIVMALRIRKDFLGYDTNIHTQDIYKTSQLLCHITGIDVQRNKAIVGKNAFAHEAGIHQHGVIKNAMTYEIMTPESVGILKSNLVLGKHSGRHALKQRYKELGFELSKEQLNKIYNSFTDIADRKKSVYDADLIAILQNNLLDIPEFYTLEDLHVLSGNNVTPTATIKLKKGDEIIEDSATGDGPVDAVYRAIDRITSMNGELISYSIKSVTRGKDALGEVFIQVEFNGVTYGSSAASTDVVEASAKAYLSALNIAHYTKMNSNPEFKKLRKNGIRIKT